MTLLDYFSNITAGGIVSIVVIILSLIEITPIKVSPLAWIGKRVNHEMVQKVDDIESKLNTHIVESYRNNILNFADSVMGGQIFTSDKWGQMLNTCAEYERVIKEYNLTNGQATAAISYLRKEYQKCANAGRFAGFPQN